MRFGYLPGPSNDVLVWVSCGPWVTMLITEPRGELHWTVHMVARSTATGYSVMHLSHTSICFDVCIALKSGSHVKAVVRCGSKFQVFERLCGCAITQG